jgi:hypothetical protein
MDTFYPVEQKDEDYSLKMERQQTGWEQAPIPSEIMY